MPHTTQGKRPLQKMFTSVPPSYDRLNRILTLGADEGWRRKAIRQCLSNEPETVLDLCCGTGDLVLSLKQKASPSTRVMALDFSEPMLELAKQKAARKNIEGIEFIYGDAADMPFDDNSIDSIGIAFGFRNLTFENPDRDIFLKEILRVLKPGGQLVIVETSQPDNALWKKMYHLYMGMITAPIGGLLSGQKSAYKYLAYSAKNFYTPHQMQQLLKGAGFSTVSTTQLMGGISALTTAIK